MNIINQKHQDLRDRKNEFLNNEPFPHLVLDEFLEPEYFSCLKKVFNEIGESANGKSFDTEVEKNKWISLNSSLPEKIKQIVEELNSNDWVENIRNFTGINSLITTQYGNTELANFHEMKPEAVLGPHVDHSFEPHTGKPHVLNVLIYLTEDWDKNDGGSTILYDKTGKNIVSKVEYEQNRAVIFLHTPFSFHGVEKIAKEANKKRNTIYVDYYSESFKPYEHFDLKFSARWFKHGTTFILNNYTDYLKPKNIGYTKALLQYQLNKFRANV